MTREINKNGQEALLHTQLRSAQHRFAKLTLMHCHECNTSYLGQSCDAHERRCPHCQCGASANTADQVPGFDKGNVFSAAGHRPFDGDCVDDVDITGPVLS